MMMKKKLKKKKKPADSGYSKGVFYAMAFLCLASFTTACVTLGGYFGKDDNDRIHSDLDSSHTVVEVVPKQTEVDADAEITLINPPVEDERWLHLGVTEKDLNDQIGQAIADHLAEHNKVEHTYGPHYTLLKCHQLGTNTFSCKIVRGKNVPLPKEEDVPIVDLTEEQEEIVLENDPAARKEEKNTSWNPFD
jgi:hypothetical protein